MTDHRLKAEMGSYALTGYPATLTVTRGAETWQFFAFIFAAVLTLVLALVDEIPEVHWRWRIAAKVLSFVGLAYFMLINIRVRNWLARLLLVFKDERR
jgi:hypothetical protein